MATPRRGPVVAALVAVLALVGAVAWGTSGRSASPTADASTASPTDPGSSPASPAPTGSASASASASIVPADTSGWYAVLLAPGWVAPDQDAIDGAQAAYVRTDGTPATATLNWRGEHTLPAKVDALPTMGGRVATTTIAGDKAVVYGSPDGRFVVVGPAVDGRFLTLVTQGLTLAEVVDLAPHVTRQ